MAIKARTAARLRELAEQIDAARQEREDLVVAAYREGGSLREIAELAGLTHMGVSKMLKRLGEREPWSSAEQMNAELNRRDALNRKPGQPAE